MADPNIFARYAQPVRGVADYIEQYDQQDARREDLAARRSQNALQSMAMRRQIEADGIATTERNALRQIAQQYGNDEAGYVKALRGSGMPGLMTQADSIEAAGLKRRDTQSQIAERGAKTKASEYDLRIKQSETALRDIAALGSVQDAVAGIQRHLQNGDIDDVKAQALLQSLPQNPADFSMWQVRTLKGILSAKERLEAEKLAFNTSNTGGSTVTTGRDQYTGKVVTQESLRNTQSPDNAASNARMAADAEASRAQSERHFNTTRADTLAGGGKPATESERTAGFLLQRIRDSQRQLNAVTSQNPGAAKPGVVQESARLVSEPLANVITSGDRQQVESAQLDILDAALTLGTGAAYTREQLQGYRKSYFPQLGDKPDAVREKAVRLNNLIKAAEVKAGRAARDVNQGGIGGVSGQAEAASGPARVASDADYNALPSGATFVGPDGKTRRKP